MTPLSKRRLKGSLLPLLLLAFATAIKAQTDRQVLHDRQVAVLAPNPNRSMSAASGPPLPQFGYRCTGTIGGVTAKHL